ncbi:uncharacterized protein LOC143721277 [Siphateles boraxobius]|uniref:uncharacterized protein LOC143721277 n=1 Tax=Siphateles boraxobius TaxID=180520 RepID=UPI004063CAD7
MKTFTKTLLMFLILCCALHLTSAAQTLPVSERVATPKSQFCVKPDKGTKRQTGGVTTEATLTKIMLLPLHTDPPSLPLPSSQIPSQHLTPPISCPPQHINPPNGERSLRGYAQAVEAKRNFLPESLVNRYLIAGLKIPPPLAEWERLAHRPFRDMVDCLVRRESQGPMVSSPPACLPVIPEDLSFEETRSRIPLKLLKSYYWTSNRCPLRHKVFVTVKQHCVNPDNEWVQLYTNHIDKRNASNPTK